MRLVLFVLAIGVITVTSILGMIASSQPHWIEQVLDVPAPITKLRISYGLFEKCDSSILEPDVWTCRTFPKNDADCKDPTGLSTSPAFPPASSSLYRALAQDSATADSFEDDDEEDLPYSKPLFWSVVRNSMPLNLFLSKSQNSSSFCSYWRLAGYFSQLSLAFGGAGVLSLLVVLGGGRRKRRTAWPVCAAFVLLHSFFQLVLWALVIHAYRTDSRFGDKSTRLGYSFGFSSTAWILDALLAGVMIFTGVYGEWEIPEKSERSGLISSRSYGTLPGSDERVNRRRSVASHASH